MDSTDFACYVMFFKFMMLKDAKSDAQKKDESKNEPPPPPSPKTHHERVSLRVTLFQDVPTVSSPEEIVSYQHRYVQCISCF